MKLKEKIKKRIIIKSINKRNKLHPFDIQESERFQLSQDADLLETNSYYFSGHNPDGTSFYCRCAFRGGDKVEVWFFYQTKDGKTYYNLTSEFTKWDAPISVECLDVGKKWLVIYKGSLSQGTKKTKTPNLNDPVVEVEAKAVFSAVADIFDFEHHVNPEILASALSKEKWDKNFRYNNKLTKQTHYEQQGSIDLTIFINKVVSNITFVGMRDHSYGRRDWKYMDKHIWLMALIDKNTSLNLNMVNYPHMKLITGYYEQQGINLGVTNSTKFCALGAHGEPKEEFDYFVVLENKQRIDIHAKLESFIRWDFNHSYYICEGLGTFTINGVTCRGIIEYGFNFNASRWKELNENI